MKKYLGYYSSEVDFGILELSPGDEQYDSILVRDSYREAHNDLLRQIQEKINKLRIDLKCIRTMKQKDLIR